MKRHLLIALACLLIGAVGNVLVAWGCALWCDRPSPLRYISPDWAASPTWDGQCPADTPPPRDAAMEQRFGIRRYFAWGEWRSAGPAEPWYRWDGTFTLERSEFGIPARSMSSLRTSVNAPRSMPMGVVAGSSWEQGLRISDLWLRRLRADSRCTHLPLRPLWGGLAANVLVWAVPAWIALTGASLARRALRRRRHLCPTCGYPVGTTDECSECGGTIGPVGAPS